MKKLLVTGASGFLGCNLCQAASKKWHVYGTYFSQKVEMPGISLFKIDLKDYRETADLFETIKPDAVIHTAAASKPNYCQTHPEESYAINVTAAINIARLCQEYKIHCAFTSTDLVFNGQNPVYSETSPVSPICYYGEQKVAAEVKMSEITDAIALCRMPLMFGLPSPVSASFLQGMINNLKANREVNLFTDEFRTPASAATASTGLLLAVEQEVKGVLHLGGKERISRYDFGVLVADLLNKPKKLIQPILQSDIKTIAKRSPDTSLDSNKAFSMGYQPLSVKEELTRLI